jgi:hypothetical protein
MSDVPTSHVVVTGPISGGAHGWPFGAAVRDLVREGYVEEEYFFEGDAQRYRPQGELGVDGRWHAEPTTTGSFTTRALVRRPADPARFNGTVIVEWNNVSAGCEIFEAGDTSVVFDDGFASVGVSAQRVGVHGQGADPQGLRAWDPQRYASLDIADDALSYGVFTAVAAALSPSRPTTPVDPLRGLEVQRLLAVGGSQSAGRLATYINAIQPLERMFDGFVLFTWFGSGMSIDDPATLDISAGGRAQILAHPTQIRSDLDVPVMVVNSECETVSVVPVRQPDTDRFRFWEVAGAPHGPRLHMERIAAKMLRDGVGLLGAPGAPAMDLTSLGPVPFAGVLDAALAHTQTWMADGTSPPRQPLIEVDGDPPHIRRDVDGNAVGGLRLPEMDVTLTRNVGSIEESGAAGLMGITTPLPTEVVRDRYPDLDRYVAAFRAAADRAVAVGVLRRRDADEAIERAKTVTL